MQNYVERLAAKYQRSVEEAQQMIDNMTAAISDAGGNADFGKVIAANTFDAHRLIQWVGETDRASEAGDAQHQLTDAFMRGYLGDGINLGRKEDLLGVVESVGGDVTRFRQGDTVFGCVGLTNRNGACAEYTLIDERVAAGKPERHT